MLPDWAQQEGKARQRRRPHQGERERGGLRQDGNRAWGMGHEADGHRRERTTDGPFHPAAHIPYNIQHAVQSQLNSTEQ